MVFCLFDWGYVSWTGVVGKSIRMLVSLELPFLPNVILQFQIWQSISSKNASINHNVTNKAPAHQTTSLLRSDWTFTYYNSRSDLEHTHVPLPTLMSTSTSTLTTCFLNVCGVTASPAPCSTHIHSSGANSAFLHHSKKCGALSSPSSLHLIMSLWVCNFMNGILSQGLLAIAYIYKC